MSLLFAKFYNSTKKVWNQSIPLSLTEISLVTENAFNGF